MSYLQAGVKTMTNVATADNELSITPSASDGQSEPGEQATFFRMIRYYATLSDCLRLAGALAVALCLLYTSPSPRDGLLSRMPSSA